MKNYKIVKLTDQPGRKEQAANWFSQKWSVPLSAYQESMSEALSGDSPVPQWYLALDKEEIIGGLGVIENDFHNRRDLAPNVCGVFVENPYRCQGIAGELLCTVCDDMAAQGIETLYLLTDHTSFYERYGWEFFCMVRGDGEPEMSRMYIHKAKKGLQDTD